MLQLQSSAISLTQRLGTHFEYQLVTSCHTSHLRGVNKQEAARANMAKAAATAKSAGERVPRKGKRTHGGGPEKRTPKKDRTNKFCTWCKAVGKPFLTHDTTDCRRFNEDGSRKDRLTTPFDSANKPWKTRKWILRSDKPSDRRDSQARKEAGEI